ncbi:MAG: DUF421 domain-containing protein [Sphingobacteriales bacterium]|nr:MAG: DUF421 domain-containing protein [Sphingobacteriales bacterium]
MAEATRKVDRIDVAPRFTQHDAIRLNNMFRGTGTQYLLRTVLGEHMLGDVALVSSFGAESAALLQLVASVDRDVPILFLDTGKHTDAKDEFFAEMRQQNIEHVGQIRIAILESNGTVSFFYYADEDVKPGLPILPKIYQRKRNMLAHQGQYACTTCGQVQDLPPGTHTCPRCQETEWVEAIQTLRIA